MPHEKEEIIKSKNVKVDKPSMLIERLENGMPTKIVLYGTSLTAGDHWGGLLRTWLDTEYPGLATVINSGGNGKNSVWGRENLAEKVLAMKPDVVFLEFAMNDAGVSRDGQETPQVTLDEARANLEYMVDCIGAQNNKAEIILQTMNCCWDSPFGSGISAKIRPHLADYYQMYRNVAAERGLLLIDNYRNWIALREDDLKTYQRYVRDGVHPIAEGYADVVMPVLKCRLTGSKRSGRGRTETITATDRLTPKR